MLLMNKEKIQIDGVDVYPDHEDSHQFWMVPGRVQLATRDGRKALSYLWYIDGKTDTSDKTGTNGKADTNGTGFLNFEVNTAIGDDTRGKIRDAIYAAHPGLTKSEIRLSAVSYDRGQVNFSVLGPMATQAGSVKANPTVLLQTPEQIVWNAGSSSLVGDNAAVCSVKFTKEGGLAAAMAEAIEQQANMIVATYSLEFTALRPAVRFNVKGKLSEVRQGLKASIGAGIPLEVFMLNVGTSANLEKIMRDVGLEITVVDFAGDEETGLDWAKQIVMDYILKNFLKVDLGNGDVKPISEVPKVASAVQRAKDVSKQAEDKAVAEGKIKPDTDKEPAKPEPGKPVVKRRGAASAATAADITTTAAPGADKPKDDKPAGDKPKDDKAKDDKPKDDKPAGDKPKDDKPTDDKSPPKPTAREAAVQEVAKNAVASSLQLPIPQVNIQIDFNYQVQENSIDFTYSETKARAFTVAPQGLVLEELGDGKTYVVSFSRNSKPFGLPHPVNVTAPTAEAFSTYGLRAINLTASYPAEAPSNKQQHLSATITKDKFDGSNPLPFTFDAEGSRAVRFDSEFVFDASSSWRAAKNTYKVQGVTESGVDVQPGSHLGFLDVKVLMSENFNWKGVDQVIVTISGAYLSGPAKLVFQKNDTAVQTASFRTEARDPAATYEVQALRGGVEVWRDAPAPVVGNSITVYDHYASHVPITIRNKLTDSDFAVVTVLYSDPENDYQWESAGIELEKSKGDLLKIVIPTKRNYNDAPSKLLCTVRVETENDTYEKEVKGGGIFLVTGKPPAR